MFARIESTLRRIRRHVSHREWAVRHLGMPRSEDTGEEPGLLLIQVDGLSRRQLERAVASGRMPFLRRLIRRDGYQASTFYPGIPSTTAAVQAELYYGVRAAVPAFSFYDRIKRCHGVMCSPEWAKDTETGCQAQAEGLLRDGSSWSNIYTGGARQEDSHFCAASIGFGDMWRSGKITNIFIFILLHPVAALVIALLLFAEIFAAAWDVLGGLLHGEPLLPELQMAVSRVFIAIGLRELVTIGAGVDLARGIPVVHVNYLGYDEHSHRRGPGSAFAHWSLGGIDRSIRTLFHAAENSTRRDYVVWIFSDHGQERTRSFDVERDGGIEAMVHDALEVTRRTNRPARARSQRRPPPSWVQRGRLAERRFERWTRAGQLKPHEIETVSVAAVGPVGHVYFAKPLEDDRLAAVARRLVSAGVPGVLFRRPGGPAVLLHAGGETPIPGGLPALLPHDPPLREEIAADLDALAQHPNSGGLILLGWMPGSLFWTFAPERGAHGGIGPDETRGFVLLPPRTRLPAGTRHHIRPAALRAAALHLLGRAPLEVPTPVPVAGETLSLRVLTYNTHSCAGTDGRVSPRRIARVIAGQSPDLVALQELDLGRRRSRAEDQASMIAESLGMHVVFCPTVTRGDEHYGHALLSRWPIEVVRRAFLPSAPGGWFAEPRAALWARVVIGARRLNVITTHLGLGTLERRMQMQALMGPEWIGAIPEDEDVLLCGDFNAMPGSHPYRLASRRLRDAQGGVNGHRPLRTFTSMRPFARIDHIFVSTAVTTERAIVPRNRLTRIASDHLPLVVDFSIGSANGETKARTQG